MPRPLGIALLLLAAGGTAGDAPVLSPDRARVFPVPSGEAFAALERVLARHGLPFEARDPEHGVLRTRSRPLAKLGARRPDPDRIVPGAHAVSFEVHAFVSRDLEPAHVHVDTRVNLRRGGARSTSISPGSLGGWLLDALAAELGKEGRPMPHDEEGLARLGRELGFPATECTQGELRPPEIIRSTKVFPQYPEGSRRRGDDGKVLMRVRVLPDGSVLPASITVTRSAYGELVEASVAAVQLWRYRAARNGTCPVGYETTVGTSFASP